MTTREEIADVAAILEWDRTVQGSHDVLLRGHRMIDVTYRADGTVHTGCRYKYFAADNLHLTDRTRDRRKKTEVLKWLAE